MARLLRFVRGTAFRRGVLGTSRGWFGLWAAMGVARFLKARLGKEPVVVERYVLRSGEAIEVRDTGIERRRFGSLRSRR